MFNVIVKSFQENSALIITAVHSTDFNSGNTEFNSDKFSEDLDSIYSLIKNDTTDENVYYFLYENINNGASILYKEMPAFSIIVKTYSCLKYLGSTPVFVNNYNMDDDSISASIDVGIAVNDNCKNYCLSLSTVCPVMCKKI